MKAKIRKQNGPRSGALARRANLRVEVLEPRNCPAPVLADYSPWLFNAPGGPEQSSGTYNVASVAQDNNSVWWMNHLSPNNPTDLPALDTTIGAGGVAVDPYYGILLRAFPGWTFSTSGQTLDDNSLIVHDYATTLDGAAAGLNLYLQYGGVA